MAAERLARILARLSEGDGSSVGELCRTAADVTGMSGAGVMLLAGDQPQASLCSSDAVSASIEDFQYSLGEGPCVDAHRSGTVIAEPDLGAPSVVRWPAFAPRALASGARAVFGYPVRIGTVRIGALNLYRDRPGALDDGQHADALVVADVAARAILASQAQAPPGQLAADLAADTERWDVVNQAAGMISYQLDISVAAALVRLRAYAFHTDRLVTEVARDVVERRLRLDG